MTYQQELAEALQKRFPPDWIAGELREIIQMAQAQRDTALVTDAHKLLQRVEQHMQEESNDE